MKGTTFFSQEERLEALANRGEAKFLNELNRIMPWESFRPILQRIRKGDGSKGGRPPFDEIMMLKCLILQTIHGFSDEETEYRILDSNTYSHFLGIESPSDVPDSNTIWLFREKLQKQNLIEEVFYKFYTILRENGLEIKKGVIVDATFVTVPKQRNTREENASIKSGEIPKSFEKKTAQQRNHKDVDARWVTKGGVRYFGFKNHVGVTAKTKLVHSYGVTPASVHDSQMLSYLLPGTKVENISLYADSAYYSEKTIIGLKELGYKTNICEKGYRNAPLTEKQKVRNRKISHVRSRVEHVFGYMVQHGGKAIRTIGIERARAKIGLMNLVYNMARALALIPKRKKKLFQFTTI